MPLDPDAETLLAHDARGGASADGDADAGRGAAGVQRRAVR